MSIVTESRKKEVVQKLEPYLKMGLSLRMACTEAEVPRRTVYDWMSKDESFLHQIQVFQQYLSVVTSNAIVHQLFGIIQKQNSNVPLTDSDLNFLKWFVLNSTATKEEFGKRNQIVSIFDPEAELQILLHRIDENTSDKTTNEQLGESLRHTPTYFNT